MSSDLYKVSETLLINNLAFSNHVQQIHVFISNAILRRYPLSRCEW